MGPRVELVRRNPVAPAVAREEDEPDARDPPGQQCVRRGAPGRVDGDPLRILERVDLGKAGAADAADRPPAHGAVLPSTRMIRKSLTLVPVGPVTNKALRAANQAALSFAASAASAPSESAPKKAPAAPLLPSRPSVSAASPVSPSCPDAA